MKGSRTKTVQLLLYILGVAILSFGVVLNIKTDYGVSPVNSVPYAISVITGIELGNATILCYLVYMGIEMILMKRNKDFEYKILLQLPVGILFGKFTTFFNQMLDFQIASPIARIFLLITAVILTALGIVIMVGMNIVPIPPDGLAKEIAVFCKKDLGMGKMIFDFASVLLTLLISIVFGGKVIGLGIGTIVCVYAIGRSVKMIQQIPIKKVL